MTANEVKKVYWSSLKQRNHIRIDYKGAELLKDPDGIAKAYAQFKDVVDRHFDAFHALYPRLLDAHRALDDATDALMNETIWPQEGTISDSG